MPSSWTSVTLFFITLYTYIVNVMSGFFPEWQRTEAILGIWHLIDQHINCFVLTRAFKVSIYFVKILGHDQSNP